MREMGRGHIYPHTPGPVGASNWTSLVEKTVIKGTVARDFIPLFFHESTPYSPEIHTLKYFRIHFQIHGDIQI